MLLGRPMWCAALAASVCLLVAGPGCRRLVAPAGAPPKAPEAAAPPATAPAAVGGAQVSAELTSPRLLYDPAPPRRVEPILKRFMAQNPNLEGNLQVETGRVWSPLNLFRHITMVKVRFSSHPWRGQIVRIFGYYAHPRGAGPFPALLLVHGGGGYATVERVVEAARKGYAALAIDLPGKGTNRERYSRSTGPDMTVPQIFTVKPDLTDNYIYNAVVAQLRSISFLRAQPEVDRSRIGLVGVSWGGATGLITASLDKRIQCFVDYYGSGFVRGGSTWHDYIENRRNLPEAEVESWEDHFDASRYVADIKIPVLGITGTNDNCYYLGQFQRTLSAIEPVPDLILRPNLDHKIDPTAHEAVYKWLNARLQNPGRTPMSLADLDIRGTEGGVRVSVRAAGSWPVVGAEVCYGPVGGNIGWTTRRWTPVPCAPVSNRSWWTADFALPTQLTLAFATVYFRDGAMLSTPVHTLARARLDGKPIALQTPTIYDGTVQVEAHAFAAAAGTELALEPTGRQVTLSRNGKQATLPAQRLGELAFIGFRQACQGLGGTVDYRKDGSTVAHLPHPRPGAKM